MLDSMLRFSIEKRVLVLWSLLLIIAIGGWNASHLNVDAVPDITNVQVQINTAAPGYSPLEIEQQITYFIENALTGLPELEYTRSISRYGLSQVTAVFTPKTDLYFARNLINTKLNEIKSDIPPGLEPSMSPVSTGLGEIFMYTVSATANARRADGTPYTTMDLREIHDWVIKPQMLRTVGVAEVNSIGGYNKQFHVMPDPIKLLNYDVSLAEISHALSANNGNRGAGYIENNGQQLLVRSQGQLGSIADIENVIIARPDKAPLRIRDVATVALGHELRTGAATSNGKETVLGTVMMLIGENSRDVAARASAKLADIQTSLPNGIIVSPVYNRTDLVDKAVTTVARNLLEGALLVVAILFLLLKNIRAALITAAVIPLAFMLTITGMVNTGVSANLMSLGALDFGLIVDGSVIIMENAIRRLGEARGQHSSQLPLNLRLKIVYDATREVAKPSLFGITIITLVYLPIFSLTGVEGKMFHPMALTVVFALLAAMLLSFTAVPAAIAVCLRQPRADHEGRLFSKVTAGYAALLKGALRWRWLVLVPSVGLIVLAAVLIPRLGSEFLPQLNEGDIALHAIRIPGTGLQQSVDMQAALEQDITGFPEVTTVFSRIGTAEVATDPMPPNVADVFIMLKPHDEWPNPEKTKNALVEEIAQSVNQLLGNNYEFTQPIQMRFNELLSGVRADLGVKIYGDDLDLLLKSAQQVLHIINRIPGASDARVEQVTGLPTLSVIPKPAALGSYGLNLEDLQQWVATTIGGKNVGLVQQGDRRFDLVVRFAEPLRKNTDRLKSMPVAVPGSTGYVPLGELATLQQEFAPAQISRENGKRRIIVTANIRNRDLGSFVTELQQEIAKTGEIPPGYWVEYGGSFEQLNSALARLAVIVPLTLLMILGLLTLSLSSFKNALIIFTAVPLAITGGVFALLLRDMPFSITAGVGFIALSGIAVLNGLVMLSVIQDDWRNGKPVLQAVVDGAKSRLRPVLMTALVASLGFLPMALNTGIGAEVQRPLATVVIGGIFTSTLLTLAVLPVLFHWLHRTPE
ncbi:CusA/CzcA family heavy metal efflux RND transporter [Teredinibacter turnerae]|uniref:efflux RND transporter permease subunit n=1 Tax=Teredinibacter turnerae TaxID=2426 RepID=UPI00036E1C87|nr:CusA/CzcA family heavy metal efflux RND transporter [Teredinibacter turnerae]